MPLRLDIKRKLSSHSDRVKSVDIHPTEPWVLSAMYNGHVFLWNYNTQGLVKSFEVSDQPVRAGKFVARKQWIVAGADDMQVRVYNYNTMEKVKVFEAHSDYIRCIAVHPSQSLILTTSDDMTIRLWDWEKNWTNTMTFEGHSHYVMMVAFNPKDTNTFASASLDRTVKVWSITNLQPHFTLEGHDKGVNCVEYFAGGDRPYLVTGADDHLVKVWDYQTKQCVQTMEGHTHNVATVCCHPELPIILSGSEDGTVKIWHSTTYRLENTLHYSFERCWSIAALKGTNNVAIGYDEGTIAIQLGNEDPIASMDSSGKIVIAKHNEISQYDLKKLGGEVPVDGERLPLVAKELDVCEIYPQSLAHNANGRFAVVTGDGEYIIYTALIWRKKAFGVALDFVWARDSGEYAVRENQTSIKIFKNFTETKTFKPPFSADQIFGGALLGVRSGEVMLFFDFAECRLVRRIDVTAKDIKWSESGELMCIACQESFFILRYNRDLVNAAFESDAAIGSDGIEGAFTLVHEVSEQLRTFIWVGDCLIYSNTAGRLNYTVGADVITVQHLDRPLYIVGYLPKENRLYMIDRDCSIVSYQLLLSVIEYQTAVVRRDFEAAAAILPSVPRDEYNRIARFLESQGFKEEALAVATDPEHQFELAVQLGKLQTAYEITKQQPSESKWKQLGDLALVSAELQLAEECLVRAADLPGLLLLYSSCGHAEGMEKLAELSRRKGKLNIAFICSFLRGKTLDCLQLLLDAGRAPEAAFFARTYAPSCMSDMVKVWREELAKVNPKAAESIADPVDYPNLFEGLHYALQAEEWLKSHLLHDAPASVYREHANDNESDLIEHMKFLQSQPQAHLTSESIDEGDDQEKEAFQEANDGLEPSDAQDTVDVPGAAPVEVTWDAQDTDYAQDNGHVVETSEVADVETTPPQASVEVDEDPDYLVTEPVDEWGIDPASNTPATELVSTPEVEQFENSAAFTASAPSVTPESEEKQLERELEASLAAQSAPDFDDDLDAELEAELNQ